MEVECLGGAVTGLSGGLEAFGMDHAATELGHTCMAGYGTGTCACTEENCDGSCLADSCECSGGEG